MPQFELYQTTAYSQVKTIQRLGYQIKKKKFLGIFYFLVFLRILFIETTY